MGNEQEKPESREGILKPINPEDLKDPDKLREVRTSLQKFYSQLDLSIDPTDKVIEIMVENDTIGRFMKSIENKPEDSLEDKSEEDVFRNDIFKWLHEEYDLDVLDNPEKLEEAEGVMKVLLPNVDFDTDPADERLKGEYKEELEKIIDDLISETNDEDESPMSPKPSQ